LSKYLRGNGEGFAVPCGVALSAALDPARTFKLQAREMKALQPLKLCCAVILVTCAIVGAGQNRAGQSGSDQNTAVSVGQSANSPARAQTPDPAQVIQFLGRTISWYRQLTIEQQLASQPSDLTYYQENRRVADELVTLAFDYARSQAQVLARARAPKPARPADSSGFQGLGQAAQAADEQLQDTQTELESTRAKLAAAPPSKRKILQAQVAELESEVGLLQARRDAINNMLQFVAASNAGGGGAGLRAQIEELARSVPASLSHPSGASASENTPEPTPPATAVAKKTEPTGLWGLATDLVRLSGKLRTINVQISATKELSDNARDLNKPLIDSMRGLVQQGNQLFAAADAATATQLAQESAQLEALTNQFKQVSTELLPLGKMTVLLDIYQRTLGNWHDAVKHDATDEGQELLMRLGALAVLIAIVLGIGEIWRRTTFRYVRDARRRYQFLLLRRVVMWTTIGLIVLFTFASQLSSAVTFAGLITAGVAVALQNVIVSVVAYFFLIGKYGIRVGDRVQIGDVTGEVVDIGLVRMHIMELGGPSDSQPTGRVVAFSNSIVFQPTSGVFKQIPGTSFIWHELKLTLSSETDYSGAKQRLTDAINKALEDYRENMEAQQQNLERNLTSVSAAELRPKVKLHYAASGIEANIRFPVELSKATEMDDHVMKEIMAAMDREPKLKLVSAEMPAMKAGD
jgi:small-conductance mechanosensitive channel